MKFMEYVTILLPIYYHLYFLCFPNWFLTEFDAVFTNSVTYTILYKYFYLSL